MSVSMTPQAMALTWMLWPAPSLLFDKAVSLLGGGIDILLNNAGVQRRNHCEDFTLEDWDTVIGVNLNAVFVLWAARG